MIVNTKIEPYGGGFRVFTSVNGASWWAVGVTFPTIDVARAVADTILDAAAEQS